MTLRFVAIPLIAAICAGSPAMASPATDGEQQVRGKGPRDRGASSGGSSSGGGTTTSRGGGSSTTTRRGDGGDQRRTERRGDDGQRAGNRGDRDGDNQRYAVPRDRDANRSRGRRDNRPVIVSRNRPDINIHIGSSYRGQRYYSPFQYDRWARQYYRWSPIGYAPWALIYGSIGYANYGYYGGYGPHPAYGTYGYGYGGGAWQPTGYDIGGVRLKIRPRDAQVFVDGYYAGLVDDFDGTFQSLRLEQGGHKIEVRMPGFEDLELDVHVQPGRTITMREDLRPRP
jgi:hypothetical protein